MLFTIDNECFILAAKFIFHYNFYSHLKALFGFLYFLWDLFLHIYCIFFKSEKYFFFFFLFAHFNFCRKILFYIAFSLNSTIFSSIIFIVYFLIFLNDFFGWNLIVDSERNELLSKIWGEIKETLFVFRKIFIIFFYKSKQSVNFQCIFNLLKELSKHWNLLIV